MKKYYLLRLVNNSNFVLYETESPDRARAIAEFKSLFQGNPEFSHINLDDDGYAKVGNVSYCVATNWNE